MKKERKEKRKELRVKMPMSEYEHLVKECSDTIYRSLTEFVRKKLAGKPIIVHYRNKSFDDFVNEAVLLREEIQTIRTRMPLSKDNEERLIELAAKIKEGINKLVDTCLQRSDLTKAYRVS